MCPSIRLRLVTPLAIIKGFAVDFILTIAFLCITAKMCLSTFTHNFPDGEVKSDDEELTMSLEDSCSL